MGLEFKQGIRELSHGWVIRDSRGDMNVAETASLDVGTTEGQAQTGNTSSFLQCDYSSYKIKVCGGAFYTEPPWHKSPGVDSSTRSG